jgi:hypothetical protein
MHQWMITGQYQKSAILKREEGIGRHGDLWNSLTEKVLKKSEIQDRTGGYRKKCRAATFFILTQEDSEIMQDNQLGRAHYHSPKDPHSTFLPACR